MLYFYNMSRAERDESVFKALADARRRKMLDLLRDHPRSTKDLCDRFPELDRCTVMQHLRVLEESGLVIVRREGRVRWNHLNAVPIKRIFDRWIGKYAAHAVTVLDQIGRAVAE